MTEERALRRSLAQAGRTLYRQGMMPGPSGNLSARLDAERILITPSGRFKGRLRPDDMLVIDLEGRLLAGEGHPSSETPLHLAIYHRFPQAAAVVHAHPLKATALAATHRPIPVEALPEALFALGDIPLVPYQPAATPALGAAVTEALAEADCALLLNHGAVTVGKSVDDAVGKMEILEALAETAIHACMLGGAVPLPPGEVARLRSFWRARRWL